MTTLWYCVFIVAIAAIYFCWRASIALLHQRRDRLRRRVTWMLWVMAQDPDSKAALT